jgi:RimJ/RimL family protein N-acetyltransferase
MLIGDRVTLRALTREDLTRQWTFNNDLAFELAGGGDPPMPQSFERLLADFDRQVSEGGRNGEHFAIDVAGVYIGSCGLFNIDPVAHTCELGIGIGDPAYRGKGYGREAIKLLLHYAFVYQNRHKVWLSTHSANQAAIRAYLACGFREEGRQREQVWSNGAYHDRVLMGILRSEWQSLPHS